MHIGHTSQYFAVDRFILMSFSHNFLPEFLLCVWVSSQVIEQESHSVGSLQWQDLQSKILNRGYLSLGSLQLLR